MIDKSGANTAAIESHNVETEAAIEIRQVKYLNNLVEQDHRAIKRLVRPMLGFKSFWQHSMSVVPAIGVRSRPQSVEIYCVVASGQLPSLKGRKACSPGMIALT
jgi:DDE domain